jgi:hypothetical protein
VTPPSASLAPRTEWTGALERVDADAVVLRTGARRRAFAREAVRALWVRREARSAAAGALRWGLPFATLGALAGAGLGTRLGGGEMCATSPGGA